MTEEMRFEDELAQTLRVLIGKTWYTVTEAMEGPAARYKTAQVRCLKMSDGKMSGIDGPIAEARASLVAECITTEAGGTVTVETVQGWSSRVVKPIFRWIKENSDLDEGGDRESLLATKADIEKQLEELDEDKAKNSPTDITDGSV